MPKSGKWLSCLQLSISRLCHTVKFTEKDWVSEKYLTVSQCHLRFSQVSSVVLFVRNIDRAILTFAKLRSSSLCRFPNFSCVLSGARFSSSLMMFSNNFLGTDLELSFGAQPWHIFFPVAVYCTSSTFHFYDMKQCVRNSIFIKSSSRRCGILRAGRYSHLKHLKSTSAKTARPRKIIPFSPAAG